MPRHESTRLQDRDAIEVGVLQRRGEDPYAFVRPDGTNDPRDPGLHGPTRTERVAALRELRSAA